MIIIAGSERTLLENPEFLCRLTAQVIPLLVLVEMGLDILDSVPWEDLI